MNEFGLIERLKVFQNLSSAVPVGIGDDAAVLRLDARRYQLLTTDMLVEDVHFTRDQLPRQVGYKAMACSISDIAAMGGLPQAAVISIGVPGHIRQNYILQIYKGLHACARAFGVSLVGGDTVRAQKFVINVALLGQVEKKYLVLRSGAKPGDSIFVTGPLGGSLRSGRHLRFIPRVKEARFLVTHFKPGAMMDISDGLAGDLGHILRASRVGACLQEQAVRCHPGVNIRQALTDGEDFELLFTLTPAQSARLAARARRAPLAGCHRIGSITADCGRLLLQGADGRCRKLAARGFVHF